MRMEHEWSRQRILKVVTLVCTTLASRMDWDACFLSLPHSFSLNWFRVLSIYLWSDDQWNPVPSSVQSLPFECCLVIFSNIMKKTLVYFSETIFSSSCFLCSLASLLLFYFDLGPLSSEQGRGKSSARRTDWKFWPSDLHYYYLFFVVFISVGHRKPSWW